MKRSDERILTTHVGSIPRPPELLELASSQSGPPADQAEYDRRLQAAVAAVVKRQVEAGVDIVNDGEFGKESWSNYILRRVSGFQLDKTRLVKADWLGDDMVRFERFMRASFPRALDGMPAEVCCGEIHYVNHAPIDRSIEALRAALAGSGAVEGFMTAVAPASTAFNGINDHYASDRDYVFAIAEALRVEYRAILGAGLVLQVDDAVLANMYDTLTRQSPERYREWAQLRVDALNHALEGLPEDRVRYHICFGSWHVPHISDAPLAEIVGLILQVKAGCYSIEAANPRHEHEWRVWEDVKLPQDRILAPGVITHHTVTVEHPRLVADRIVRFAKLVGRENVIASSDCGFAQVDNIQRADPEIMWAKFEALAEGARIATRELWGRA